MSFEINWDDLTSDASISNSVKEFLDKQFNSISLPPFIDKLSVTDFSMGATPPEIVIRHIGTPFEEFYNELNSDDEDRRDSTTLNHTSGDTEDSSSTEDEEEATTELNPADSPTVSDAVLRGSNSYKSPEVLKKLHNYNMNNLGLGPHERETPAEFLKSSALKMSNTSNTKHDSPIDTTKDIQIVLEIDYRGDIMVEISVNLLVNYPSAQFISLPIKLRITDLEIHSLAAIAYISKSVYISFLCDLDTSGTDYFSFVDNQEYSADNRSKSSTATFSGGNFVDYATANNRERIDVIRSVKIDTEIGEVENNVLRNVGKVEKFLVEQLRNIIRDEVCWPGWVCFNLNDDEDLMEDDGNEHMQI